MTTHSDELAFDNFMKLASRESILSAVDEELRLQGFAGPTEIPKLVLLSLYTRFFDQPVSLVIKGPSGSGKSFALHAGLQFVPPDAYEEFSGMSEKALVYLDGVELKHKFLVIGEAAGLAQGEGRAFLRQLLSEGKIRYATVQKTPKGLVGQELKPIEGPTGLLMTTTANALHPEDESRMLSYNIDESTDRVRDALLKQATGLNSVKPSLDTEPWFQLHEYVRTEGLAVSIPYAEQLANEMPVSHFRVQRDFPKVLSLIRAHALMHRLTREIGTHGEVIATSSDYEAVYNLVEEALAEGLEEAVPDSIRQVVTTVADMADSKSGLSPWEKGVSQVQLAEKLGRDQSVISRHVRKAIGQGFLTDLTPGQGKKATLILGDRELPSGTVLPVPDKIGKAILPRAA